MKWKHALGTAEKKPAVGDSWIDAYVMAGGKPREKCLRVGCDGADLDGAHLNIVG